MILNPALMGPTFPYLLGMALNGPEPALTATQAALTAARAGDPAGFERLVRSSQRAVFGLCLRLLRTEGEAAEVAQEAYLRAWQNLSRYDPARSFEVWVISIARNLCLDLLRKRTRQPTEDLEELRDSLPAKDPSLEEAAVAQEQQRNLEAAVAQLSVEDREVLALYYEQRRTTKEIAQVMGVAPGTIMARLFRAREKLRKFLPQEVAK